MTQPSQLQDIATATANIEPQGKMNAERATQAKEIGRGLVDALVEQAQHAAKSAIGQPSLTAWHNMLETLDALELDCNVSCAKTGRFIYAITPQHFEHYLTALEKLGESREADKLQEQLLNAILAQKAHTILPCNLTTSKENIAFIRDASPLDYALIALQRAFPIRKNATTVERAIYADTLAKARKHLTILDKTALSYLCECLHLYLSNIRPDALPERDSLNTLTHYKDMPLAKIVESPNKIAHFCRRIVQLAFNLIAKHQPRKLTHLTTRDLLNLRVHYCGLPEYKEQKKIRHAQRHAAQVQAKLANHTNKDFQLTPAMERSLEAGSVDDLEIEVFDMAAAFNTALRQEVKIAPASEKQANRYAEIKETAKTERGQRHAEPQTLTLVDIFTDQLLEDFVSVEDDELLPIIETEQDLIEHGFAIEGEFDKFLQEQSAQEEETEETEPFLDDLNADFDTPLSLALESAQPAKISPVREPSNPTPRDVATSHPLSAPSAPVPKPAVRLATQKPVK